MSNETDKPLSVLDGNFGVEFELLKPTIKRVGTGKYFESKGDGSINPGDSNLQGREYVTKILHDNKHGWSTIRRFLSRANKAGCAVNKTCGLHIHYGLRERMTPEQMQSLFDFTKQFEGVVFELVPKSRRNNRYCQSLEKMSENVTENCDYHNSYDDETDSYDDDLWCSCDECYAEIDVWCESRYYWINTTHVMNMTPHIEVRLHSGTLDYTKVKNWHSLMKRFIEYGMNNTYNGVVSIQDLFDTLELPKNEQLYWFQRRELFRDNLQRTSVESGELTENNQ